MTFFNYFYCCVWQTESALITYRSMSSRINGLLLLIFDIQYFMHDERYDVWLRLQYAIDTLDWYDFTTVLLSQLSLVVSASVFCSVEKLYCILYSNEHYTQTNRLCSEFSKLFPDYFNRQVLLSAAQCKSYYIDSIHRQFRCMLHDAWQMIYVNFRCRSLRQLNNNNWNCILIVIFISMNHSVGNLEIDRMLPFHPAHWTLHTHRYIHMHSQHFQY